jgi:hypothetical protein
MVARSDDMKTRRFVLKVGSAAVVTAAGLAVAGTASAKVPQKGVQYVAVSTKPKMNCGNCANFVKPNACKQVDGVISPQGYCMIWSPAPK